MAKAQQARLTETEQAAQHIDRWLPHGYARFCSRGKFICYPHVQHIGCLISDRVRAGGARLIITMPPRHSKSETVSAWVPPWFLDWYPDRSVMLCSYAAALADDYGRRVRNEVATNDRIWFSLREDSKAANRWHTPQGGGMVTAGVDGSITGRGFHLGIIDDPYKNWAEAKSPTVRRAAIDWYHSTFRTRAEPGASIVIVTTRWDCNDLVGYLIENDSEPWEVIRLPALAEAGDPIGRRPGEPLCPDRYDLDALQSMQSGMPPAMWQAIFQQAPEPGATGRSYPNFSEANVSNAVAYREAMPICLCADWNLNPGMHVLIGQHDPSTDTFTFVDEVHGPGMGIAAAAKEVAKRIKGAPGYTAGVQLFGDATGRSMENRASYSTVFRQHMQFHGVACRDRIPAANPRVVNRCLALNAVLLNEFTGERRMLVHPRCVRLINDLWHVENDAKGEPSKTDTSLTHPSDAAGYWVHYVRPIRMPSSIPKSQARVITGASSNGQRNRHTGRRAGGRW